MKKCNRCGTVKPECEFNKSSRSKDGLQAYCRECSKDHYRGNKTRHVANVRRTEAARNRMIRVLMVERFQGGCVDCGLTDIRVLDFDHIRDKDTEVSKLVRRGVSLERVVSEMDKCEVRCKNCHTIKTLERLGKSWHDNFI